MTIYASAETQSFYIEGLHHDIPLDAIEITEELYESLLIGRSSGMDVDFTMTPPALKDKAVLELTIEQLAAIERRWRDAEVNSTEWLVNRHRDELDMQQSPTLETAQYTELLEYRQALRDWPQTGLFPDVSQRPVAPPWIAEQIQ